MKKILTCMTSFVLSFVMIVTMTWFDVPVLAADGIVTVGITGTYGQTEARSMLSMVNEFRTGDDAWYWNSDNSTKTTCTNLDNLTYDYELEKAAMLRAMEIALSYSHTRPDGSRCFTAYSYTSAAAENIAAGYSSAEEVFEGWQETNDDYSGQGHRRNMLSSSVTAIGIGHVVVNGCHYWVQEFRSPTGSTAATTANDAKTTVSVDVQESAITKTTVVSAVEECTVNVGESIDLPDVSVSIMTANTWPESEVKVETDLSWASANSSCAAIEGDEIIGKQAGTTTVTVKALGGSDEIAVTVVGESEHSHSYGNPEFEWSDDYKSCTAVFTCEGCDDVQKIACDVTSKTTAPTCTAAGKTVYTATAEFSGNTYTDNQTVAGEAATGHTYQYTDNGDDTHTKSCEKCDFRESESHNYVNGSCQYCGAEEPEEHSHAYGDPQFEWSDDYKSCTAVFTCGGCDDVQEIACDVTSKTTAPTCTAAGKTVYTATAEFSGNTYTDNQTVAGEAATGHTCQYTDNGDGTHTKSCEKCDFRESESHNYVNGSCQYCGAEEREEHSHAYGDPEFEWSDDYKSCTLVFTCGSCDDVQEIACDVTSKTTDPTCTAAGKTVYTARAEFNGSIYTENRIVAGEAATGHTYQYTDNGDDTHTCTCNNCGSSKTEQHTYKDGKCKYCGAKEVIKVSKIKISGISKKIAAGKKIRLKAKVTPSNADNKKVTWKSSNKKIATVNSKGVVTIKKKMGGKSVTITATAKDGSKIKASYKIKVMKGVVKKIKISGSKSVKAGKKLKLKAKVTASSGANKTLKWTSGNTKYATVSSSGKVTAKKAGKGKKVKITAKATDGSGKKATITIKIK